MRKNTSLATWMATMMILSSGFAESQATAQHRSFGEDVEFLKSHVDVIVLHSDQAQVVVAPAYQGRVMTSTANGPDGTSYGWINYEQVERGVTADAPINVFGGEERFWLGPEGGQFSVFFAQGAKFEFSDWQTPPVIDTETFKVSRQDGRRVDFEHDAELTNYSGAEFQFHIERSVEVLTNAGIAESLGVELAGISSVGYRTVNRLTNTGTAAWTEETGLLSIWLLGMYKHGPQTTVVIPFKVGPESQLGPIVNDAYFGKPPADRLRIGDGALFFAADGRYRSKIGLSPQRSTPLCGSFDAARSVLTIVQYNQPGPDVTKYVNSMWEFQDAPFAGDVINAYNDGPPAPDTDPLGPFYELETSSPALALAPDATGEHSQSTFHFEGDRERLDAVSRKLLGVSLDDIESALQ